MSRNGGATAEKESLERELDEISNVPASRYPPPEPPQTIVMDGGGPVSIESPRIEGNDPRRNRPLGDEAMDTFGPDFLMYANQMGAMPCTFYRNMAADEPLHARSAEADEAVAKFAAQPQRMVVLGPHEGGGMGPWQLTINGVIILLSPGQVYMVPLSFYQQMLDLGMVQPQRPEDKLLLRRPNASIRKALQFAEMPRQ